MIIAIHKKSGLAVTVSRIESSGGKQTIYLGHDKKDMVAVFSSRWEALTALLEETNGDKSFQIAGIAEGPESYNILNLRLER